MIQLTVSIDDKISPGVRGLMRKLQSGRLARAMGRSLQNCVAKYVLVDSMQRHATARALGATPTGFRADAAKLVSLPSALTTDATGGELALPGAQFARAFGRVTIVPKNGSKFLTIPVAAESYGKRIRQGSGARFEGGFFFRSGGRLMYGIKDSGGVKALYSLVPSVTQDQDRSLLPPDAIMIEALQLGAAQELEIMRKEMENGN